GVVALVAVAVAALEELARGGGVADGVFHDFLGGGAAAGGAGFADAGHVEAGGAARIGALVGGDGGVGVGRRLGLLFPLLGRGLFPVGFGAGPGLGAALAQLGGEGIVGRGFRLWLGDGLFLGFFLFCLLLGGGRDGLFRWLGCRCRGCGGRAGGRRVEIDDV